METKDEGFLRATEEKYVCVRIRLHTLSYFVDVTGFLLSR